MIKIALDPVQGLNLQAQFRALTYNAEDKSVKLYIKIVAVDTDDNEIVGGIFKPAFVTLTADNTTPILIADGTYVDTTATGYAFDSATMIGEYDFFENIAENSQVKINDLILQKMQTAKTLGRFNI